MSIFIVNKLNITHFLLTQRHNCGINPLSFTVDGIPLKDNPLGNTLNPEFFANCQINWYFDFLFEDIAALEFDCIEKGRLICLETDLVDNLLQCLMVLHYNTH